MGLKKTIELGVAAAFKVVGDIKEMEAVYRRSTSVYSPSTGEMVTTNADETVPMIFTSYSNFAVDRIVVLATDIKCIIQQKDMRALSLVPTTETDKIVNEAGEIFNIIRIIEDPAHATYTLQLRAP